MKKIMTLLLFCGACCGLTAQTETDAKAQINEIKRSQSYLSAEATLPTEEEAIQQAKELLLSEINDWVASKQESEAVKLVVLQDINTCTQRMDMKRGVRTRAFVYVKKNDIALIYGAGKISLSEEEKTATAAETEEVEKAEVENAEVEEAEAEVPDLQPVPEISEPIKMEEPAPKPKIAEQPVSTVEKIPSEQDRLNEVLVAETMAEMKTVFASLKEQESISYGVYKPEEVADSCYLLFYTRTGDIKGVVKKKGQELKDVWTEEVVKWTDFSGCGAYWFILK